VDVKLADIGKGIEGSEEIVSKVQCAKAGQPCVDRDAFLDHDIPQQRCRQERRIWWKKLCVEVIRRVLKAPHNTLVLGEVSVLCGVTMPNTMLQTNFLIPDISVAVYCRPTRKPPYRNTTIGRRD
jgi:hypothetical protein